MSAKLPHRTFTDSLRLRLYAVLIDGGARPDLVEDHLRRIDVAGVHDEWARLTFEATIDAPIDEVAGFLDEGLQLRCTLVASCPATRLRQGFRMTVDNDIDGRWTSTAMLDADDLRGKVEIVAHLAADIGDRPARRLGWSEPWTLYVDETARPPFQGTFQVRWSHFTGPDREATVPAEASSESFFLDLTSATPAIHLNRDMEGLPELLEGDDRRPDLERALRDAEMRRIATAAWTSAIGVAAASIRVDPESGEHELPDSEWRAEVLRWSLPSIFPGAPLEEALKRIRNDLSGDEAAVTQGMIQLAVSRHMKAGDLLKRALKSTTPA